MFLHYTHADGTSFDIEKYPGFNDYFDYLKPIDYDLYDDDYKKGYEDAMGDMYSYDLFDYLDNDAEFIDFMTDRYRYIQNNVYSYRSGGLGESEVDDYEQKT